MGLANWAGDEMKKGSRLSSYPGVGRKKATEHPVGLGRPNIRFEEEGPDPGIKRKDLVLELTDANFYVDLTLV
jgi:hypothetical protein